MKTKFIKVYVSERLPDKKGRYLCQLKNRDSKLIGQYFYPDTPIFEYQWKRDVEFYLEEVPYREDEMREMLEKARSVIAKLKRSMLVHPDHEEGSEFDDLTTSAQDTENDIEQLLNK